MAHTRRLVVTSELLAGRQDVALYRVLMNINECGCRPYGWLGLDGNRCIRVIPRQRLPVKNKEIKLFPMENALSKQIPLKVNGFAETRVSRTC